MRLSINTSRQQNLKPLSPGGLWRKQQSTGQNTRYDFFLRKMY
jgi:hypothetical protein